MFPLVSLKSEFTAPEVINAAGNEVRPSRAGDVFSFAKTIYAFALEREPEIGPISAEGDRYPHNLTCMGDGHDSRELWMLLKDMTQEDPEARPKMVYDGGEGGSALVEKRLREEVRWTDAYYKLVPRGPGELPWQRIPIP